jgi:hypothetical protein
MGTIANIRWTISVRTVAKTVATTGIDGVLWSSTATGFLLSLLLHINQCSSIFDPFSDYESAVVQFHICHLVIIRARAGVIC